MAVNMTELGKTTGPEVLIRFKICQAAKTDWVGWIIGARCIDCPERGGLGFIPMENCHSFTALGIQMRRTELPGGPKPDHCYAIRSSVLDSDSESEASFSGAVTHGAAGTNLDEYMTGGSALLYEVRVCIFEVVCGCLE